MTLTLDHLVIHVRELEQAIVDYTALGFNVQSGGTHADGATHNALIVFGDGTYIELIAFLKLAPTHRWAKAGADGTEGFIDFALLPSSVGAVVEAARGRGLAYSGPHDGGRLRPDGQRLEWQIGAPPSPDLPFLCGDITPRSLRVREGEVRVHQNATQGVASITLAVSDLDASLARYRALLGPEATRDTTPLALPGLGARIAAVALGSATLVLVSPTSQEDDLAATALRQVLAQRGDALLGIALRNTAGIGARPLPLSLTHGARIELEPS